MNLDLDDPIFTHKEAAEWTSADFKTIDNYVLLKHLTPFRIDGRRLFSARQLAEIELISRLATLFKIPPMVGKKIAGQMVAAIPAVGWEQTIDKAYRTQVGIRRLVDGTVDLLSPGETSDDAVDILVPFWTFVAPVLDKATAARGDQQVRGGLSQ